MIIGITDSSLFENQDAFKERVLLLLDSELDFLILREKEMMGEELVDFLLDLMSHTDNACRKIVVHSQVEAARHLGLTSAHTLDSLMKIEAGNLFTLFSPVFKTQCKPDETPLDRDKIQKALAVASDSLVALGGITPENAMDLKKMGFKHLALRSSLMQADDPHHLIALYKEMGF